MDIKDFPPALTGDELISRIHETKEKRAALVDNLIYEQTTIMLAAGPGVGKSTLTIQMAVEMAAGLPIFGAFECARPLKVLVSQNERSIIESLERLESIGKVLPIVKENLFITDAYQPFNLLVPEHANMFVKCVLRDCPGADVIILDPIYCMVAGGLKDDTPASAFTKVMSHLQRKTKAALWYNHHTTKDTYTQRGDKVEKDDPFYGSQWLKAHVTGSLLATVHDAGVKLTKKKDNYALLPDSIVLDYDSETGLSKLQYDSLSAMDKVKAYIKARQIDQKEFSFADMQRTTQVCTRRLRELILHSSIQELIFVVNVINKKHLYRAHPAPN